MDSIRNLTGPAAARLAGVHRNTVRNYVRRGLISPPTLSDGTQVFSQEDVRVMRDLAAASRRPRKAPR